MNKKKLNIDAATILEFTDLQISLIKPFITYKPEIRKRISNKESLNQQFFCSILEEVEIPPLRKNLIAQITELDSLVQDPHSPEDTKVKKLKDIISLIVKNIEDSPYNTTFTLHENSIYKTLPKHHQHRVFKSFNLKENRENNYEHLFEIFFGIVKHIKNSDENSDNKAKKLSNHRFIENNIDEIKNRLELFMLEYTYNRISSLLDLIYVSQGVRRIRENNEENPFLVKAEKITPDYFQELDDSIFNLKFEKKIIQIEKIVQEANSLLNSNSILSTDDQEKYERKLIELQNDYFKLKKDEYFGENIHQTFTRWLNHPENLKKTDQLEYISYLLQK